MSTKPLIVSAAQKTPFLAALSYAALGMSVLPCIGKKPALPAGWKSLQYQLADSVDITRWHRAGKLKNVGVICGEVSGNLVVIDLDGIKAVGMLRRQFPELFKTYQVMSGSLKGLHLYFYVRDMPQNRRAVFAGGNIEIRGNGCYVIAPPSIHPGGKAYTVAHPAPIMTLENLRALESWLDRLKQLGSENVHPGEPVRHVSAWARAALVRECHAVEAALAGNRNNVLNRAAFKLGQLVAIGELGFDQVLTDLQRAAAALAATDGESSVVKTIHSGLRAGMENPRERTWQ